MSIWSSLGDDVTAFRDRVAAEDDLTVDVATATAFSGRIRLAVFGKDPSFDFEVFLTPEDALRLAGNLKHAAEEVVHG